MIIWLFNITSCREDIISIWPDGASPEDLAALEILGGDHPARRELRGGGQDS